jgi:hypothetical protein
MCVVSALQVVYHIAFYMTIVSPVQGVGVGIGTGPAESVTPA